MMDNRQSNPRSNTTKWFALGLGTLVGVAHIGTIGLLVRNGQLPQINLPVSEYTSYSVRAGRDGYEIKYSSNDPKTMISTRDVETRNGFFGIGGRSDVRIVTERGVSGGEEGKKISAETLECIKAAGGGESQGRVVGASLGAAAAPWFVGIPYVGPVLSGFVTLFVADKASEVGGDLAMQMEGCLPEESGL